MEILAICIDGVEDEELIAAALLWTARFDSVEVWCAYGELAGRELRHVREHHGRPPEPPHSHRHEDVDEEQAEAIVARGTALIRQANVQPRVRMLRGRDAGHAIVAACQPETTLFLAAGHGGGVGPHSVGHVARFVIDHALGPIILVRLGTRVS